MRSQKLTRSAGLQRCCITWTKGALERAYLRLREAAAPGVDGVTLAKYAKRLEQRLRALCERIHRSRYRAYPVGRAYISNADGGKLSGSHARTSSTQSTAVLP